jgi:hypothetical protein
MSQMGQTEKNSVWANVFRVTPESGHCSMMSARLKGAKLGSRQHRLLLSSNYGSATDCLSFKGIYLRQIQCALLATVAAISPIAADLQAKPAMAAQTKPEPERAHHLR